MVDESGNADDILLARIRAALQNAVAVSAARLHAETGSGHVTLSGVIPSYRSKLDVLECVQAMPGVKSVTDRIRVVPSVREADEAVADRVRTALAAHPDIPGHSVHVAVRQGHCTVSGTVHSLFEWETVQDVAGACDGVLSVRNLIMVDPEARLDDADLAREASVALAPLRRGLAGHVDAVCIDGTLVLRGEVAALWDKIQAERLVVQQVPGIRNLSNEIRVV